MTRTEAPGAGAASPPEGDLDGTRTAQAAEPADQQVERAGRAAPGLPGDRRAERLGLALTLLPLVVSAVALLVAVGGQYNAFSDHALIEMQTRSVGRNEVLVGLYSRDTWNHPGPALFYVLAPFYWLTGGMAVSISVGALVINGAAIAGMALVARRLGGTRLMLVTLMGNALLMRSLGAAFLHDPWNCYITVLPFGLLVMLSWAMWRGEGWALPVAAVVTTFLAQTHVGFVALAAPVLGWGVLGLAVATGLDPDGESRSAAFRRNLEAGLLAVGVLAVGWLPLAVDAVRNTPNNTTEIIRYFRHPDEPTQSLATGWRIMAGQFGGAPEWLTFKRTFSFGGQSPFIAHAPLPWMLVLFIAAGVVLWRRGVPGSRSLVATLAVTLAVGAAAVSRTVGGVFDYRLRWTYLPAMLAFVVVCWAGWTLAAERWPRAGARLLTPLALVVLGVLSIVNVVTAATAGTPQDDNSAAVAALTQQVLDHLPDDGGPVLIKDAYSSGAWHGRGIVLQLERRGIDVGVPENLANEYGRHRVLDDPPGTVLVVTRDDYVDEVAAGAGMRQIAEWWARPRDEIEDLLARRDQVRADVAAGRLSAREGYDREMEIGAELTNDNASYSYRVAVFVEEPAPAPGAPAG